MLARACAATLLRDAACIALLLNDAGKARKLLHQSGRHFLNLGLPVGAALITLAGLEDAERELRYFDDVTRGVREQWVPSEAREREDTRRPMTDQARSEPQQLLAMVQADWLASDRGYDSFDEESDEELRTAARRNGGHPAGYTGLTFESYLDLGTWLSQDHPSTDMPPRFASAMTTMMVARAEQLRAARKDSFHWRMVARPSELIDLDATILMYLALGRSHLTLKELDPLVSQTREELPLIDAPVQAASALRRDEGRTPSPARQSRYR